MRELLKRCFVDQTVTSLPVNVRMKEPSVKTSEDVLQPGPYTSRCCGHERMFDRDDVFQRCPVCLSLCESEPPEGDVAPKKTRREAALSR